MEINQIQINSGSKSCILFFNGWGMDSNSIKHLDCKGFDLIEIHDYSDLSNFTFDNKNYESIYLVAWSMGVWAAMNVFQNSTLKFAKKIAINGTGKPMHDSLGIARAVFEGTMNSWDESTRTKFNIRMCGNRLGFQNSQENMSNRSVENQKNELVAIYNQLQNQKQDIVFEWDTAIIGEQDFIFTSENQKNYWQTQVKCITLPIPHYPFAQETSWEDILNKAE